MALHSNRTAFRRLWSSTASANLADGILIAGLPVLATTVTTSPVLVAGVQVALMGPMALSALPAGLLADRRDRRTVIMAANVVRALGLVVVLAIGLRADWRLAAIYLAAALAGATEMLADSAAETAVPDLVPPDRLGRAHSRLIGTQVVLNDAVGAPIGGVLGTLGIGWVLLIPSALYAVGGTIVRPLRLPPPTSPTAVDLTAVRASLAADLRQGITFLWRHDTLRRIALANAVMNLGNTAIFAIAVLLVIGPLDLPRSAFGVALALFAVGGVIGTVVQDRVVRALGHRRVMIGGAAAMGVGYGLVCLTADPVVSAVAAVAIGVVGMVWNVASRVLRQRLTPPEVLGRATATMKLLALIATPAGAVLGGVVAEIGGVRSVGWVGVGAAMAAGAMLQRIDRFEAAAAEAVT